MTCPEIASCLCTISTSMGQHLFLFHRYQVSVIKFYKYQWCWSTQYTNECREVFVIKFLVMQCVLRNWIIMLHKKSFWIVPVPLVLHCGLTPLIWGIFKGPSIDSEFQWGYWAVQQVQLQQASSPRRNKICSISFWHSSYFAKRFLSPYWKIGLIYFYPSLAPLSH